MNETELKKFKNGFYYSVYNTALLLEMYENRPKFKETSTFRYKTCNNLEIPIFFYFTKAFFASDEIYRNYFVSFLITEKRFRDKEQINIFDNLTGNDISKVYKAIPHNNCFATSNLSKDNLIDFFLNNVVLSKNKYSILKTEEVENFKIHGSSVKLWKVHINDN